MTDADEAPLSEGVAALTGAFDELNALLDGLREHIEDTVEHWDGQAANTYQESRESCRASLDKQRRIIEDLTAR